MNKITIHLGSGDDTPGIIRGLWDLAGGDRSRVRTSSSGIVVDPELAYQFLSVVLGKTEPAAAPQPEPELPVRAVSPDPVEWIAPSDVVYLEELPDGQAPTPAPEHPAPADGTSQPPDPQPPAPDAAPAATPEPTPAAAQPQKPARAPRTPPRKSAPRNR